MLVWGAGREGKPWLRALAASAELEDRAVDVDPRKLGQRIHGCRIIPPAELGPPRPDRLVLVAVGSPGARAEIRACSTVKATASPRTTSAWPEPCELYLRGWSVMGVSTPTGWPLKDGKRQRMMAFFMQSIIIES